MAKTKSHFYDEAFHLKQDEGHMVHDLPELIAYVIELLEWIKHKYEKPGEDPLKLKNTALGKRVVSHPYAWWFRGVSTDKHPLESGVFRKAVKDLKFPNKLDGHADLDRRLRHEYFGETRRRFEEANRNVWDQVFEMQHYGMPTRLLDWTFSLTTAAFFAVCGARKKGKIKYSGNPTVWILNPRILSGVVLGEYAVNDYAYLEINGTKSELRKWGLNSRDQRFGEQNWIFNKLIKKEGHYPVLASWTNDRLLAQSGCFTLQGGRNKSPLDHLAQDQVARGKPQFLLKVRLNKDKLEDFWNQLHSIGMDSRFLFPEKEHISESIKQQRGL